MRHLRKRGPRVEDRACEAVGCGTVTECTFVPAVPIMRKRPDGVLWPSLTVPGWFCARCLPKGAR